MSTSIQLIISVDVDDYFRLPILSISICSVSKKIILLYATFTYIRSQCQKYMQNTILWADTGSLVMLFNSAVFKTVYGYSLYQLLIFIW